MNAAGLLFFGEELIDRLEEVLDFQFRFHNFARTCQLLQTQCLFPKIKDFFLAVSIVYRLFNIGFNHGRLDFLFRCDGFFYLGLRRECTVCERRGGFQCYS